MGNEVPSALSQYDNEVKKTKTTDTNFKGRLGGGGAKGLMQSFMDSASSYLSGKVTDLNKLAQNTISSKLGGLLSSLGISGLDINGILSGKFGFLKDAMSGILGKLTGTLQGYLKNAMAMFQALGTDTVRQLTNAAINYVSNIAEDYLNNLKSALYVDDRVFLETIKGLYYGAGADLAYNNHYLRNQCLKRDWSETLKFVDEQYGVKYNLQYKYLKRDITVCSNNSCHKNLFYIFDSIYKEIKEYKSLIRRSDNIIEQYKQYSGYQYESGYKAEVKLNSKYKADKAELEKMMVRYFKNLIVNSYTYTTSSDIRRFFSAYPEVLKPKYYGSNDDKYNKTFMFKSSDCNIMMPFFDHHNLSDSDKFTMQQVSKESAKLQDYNRTKSEETINQLKSQPIDENDPYQKARRDAIIAREEARAHSLQSQSDRSKGLTVTALTKGARGVHEDSRARYPMQNDLKSVVKYRSKNNLNNLLDSTMGDETIYITPRNKNIKSIYIVLSSREMYPDDYMVNEIFYERCKYPTMTTLKSAADKAKGLLGTSFLVQSLYDISDAIDGAAYRYTKQVEKYLLDPRKNVKDIGEATNVTFDMDNYDIELPDDLKDSLNNAMSNSNSGEVSSANGTNMGSVSELESKLNGNEYAKKETADAIRFTDTIPMTKKRDMIISHMENYYKLCLAVGIEESELKPAYSKLTYYIFAKTISNPDDLYGSLLDNATNASLTRNIQIIMSIQTTRSVATIMGVENSPNKNIFVKLFDLASNATNLELSQTGFAQMSFNYDQEHLSSLLKQHYLNKINYLKSINNKSHPSYSNFYPYKDAMTKCFVGFDRNGIFGYSEEKGRLRYTNIETGDWRCIHYSPKNGTFAAGSQIRTRNNGIMKLNESAEEFRHTNITNGNWNRIFEYSDVVFFVNDDDSLWFWNGSNVVSTGISDFHNWEIDYFKEYDIIFLKGRNNNGIKYWINNSFRSITDSGDFWNYEPLNNNGYYILYPTRSKGTIWFFNKKLSFETSDVIDALASWFTVITTLTYTYEEEKPSSEGSDSSSSSSSSSGSGSGSSGESEKVTITVTQYEFHIFMATKSGITYDVYTNPPQSSKIFNLSVMRKATIHKLSSGRINMFYYDKNTIDTETPIVYCDDGLCVYNLEFKTTETNTGSLKVIEPEDIIANLHIMQTNNAQIVDTQSTVFGTFVDYVKNSTHELWYYNRLSPTASRVKIADRSLTGIEFYIGEDGKTTIGKTSNNYYFMINESSLKPILSGADVTDGWKFEYVNNMYFLVNHSHPLGIRYVSNNACITTNITSGYWNVTCSDSKLFALSIKNTNKGIRYSSKSTINFKELPKNPYNYEDVYGYAYNPVRRVLYFGSCRDELLLDVDAIVYDIDEFIYPLTLYQIKQKLSDFAFETNKSKLQSLLDDLEGNNNLFGYILLEEDELSAGPDPDTIYYTKNNDGNYDPHENLMEFESGVEYYITVFDKTINDTNVDLSSQISEQRTIEKNSNLYSELTTYAEALNEFDVDDHKAKESLLLSMINNYNYIASFEDQKRMYYLVRHIEKPYPNIQYYTKDEKGVYHTCPMPLTKFEPGVDYYTCIIYPGANLQEKFLARIAYTRMVRKMSIDTLIDRHDGTDTKPNEVGTKDWNTRNNHITNDFLNSDETYQEYTIE